MKLNCMSPSSQCNEYIYPTLPLSMQSNKHAKYAIYIPLRYIPPSIYATQQILTVCTGYFCWQHSPTRSPPVSVLTSASPIYRYCNTSLQNKPDMTSIFKLHISIYRDTGSKVDYFTCIFNKLVPRAFFCSLLEVVSQLIALDILFMYKKCSLLTVYFA